MAKRLSELLSGLPAMRQAQALSVLQKHFDAVLPLRFIGEAQVANLDEGELRVLCSNGAVASRLRLEAKSLADALQKRGLNVRRVSLKVQPSGYRKTSPSRSKPSLPAAARQAFESATRQMEEGELKTALEQLLKHHQKQES